MTDKTPAQIEAEGGTVDVDWLGHTITLPATPDDWDINVTRAFQRGDIVGAVEGLIGEAEFAKVEKAHRKAHGGKFLNRDLAPLGDKIAEVYGLETAGN
jgi:hypothetical protein